MVAQGVCHIGLQRIFVPAKEHAAIAQVVGRLRAIAPMVTALAGAARELVARVQADDIGQGHQPNHRRWKQHRIEHHRAVECSGRTRQHQSRQHRTEAVTKGKYAHITELVLVRVPRRERVFRTSIPAHEAAAMITVAMALDVGQEKVEMGVQAFEQGRVGQTTVAIAMQEMDQWSAAGRRM